MPDALGQLLAPIRGAATKTGYGLEKKAPTRAPKSLFFARIDDLGMGNMFQQKLLGGLLNAQRLELRSVTEQGKPPLIGIEGMDLRMGC